MTMEIMAMVIAAACFLAAILNLALKSRYYVRLTGAALALTTLIGAVLYGYGFTHVLGFTPVAIVRTLLAMSRMFAGVNDFSAIQTAPWFRSQAVLCLFWLGHFLGFYVTASATISALGERLLRRIRVLLLRRGTLLLIYGAQPNAVAYGRDAARARRCSVLFVDPDDAGAEPAVRSFGAVLENRRDALSPDARFLRRVGIRPGGRRLEAALLHPDGRKNLQYARALREALAAAGIPPEQTTLLVSGVSEAEPGLQAADGKGFGSVYAFDEYELAARLAVRRYPPCERLTFDAQGRAEGDYRAVVVGFGRMGHAVLDHLIMNGQFEGSRFRADVFDPRPQNGLFLRHPAVEAYDIRFHPADAYSADFYAFLAEQEGIRTIVLCTGSAARNRELADDLCAWYRQAEDRPLILLVSRAGLSAVDPQGGEVPETGLYQSDVLDVRRMDAGAMQINAAWQKDGRTPEAAWRTCDPFSRASCRAAADFSPAFLRAAHATEEEVAAGKWPPEGETLENLARTEHLRWCAFHTVMGYRRMEPAVWEERARAGDTPVGRDRGRRLHACLIPWEELGALSRRENAVTGGHVDYQEMDRENVRAVPKILTALSDRPEG